MTARWPGFVKSAIRPPVARSLTSVPIVVEGGASGGNLAQAAGEIVNYYFSAEHTVESVDAENTLLR